MQTKKTERQSYETRYKTGEKIKKGRGGGVGVRGRGGGEERLLLNYGERMRNKMKTKIISRRIHFNI